MSFILSILRPDDLLNLEVKCVSLRIETDDVGRGRLLPAGSGEAFLVFTFPPQSITERAYYDGTNAFPIKDPADSGKYNDPPAGTPPVIDNPDAPGDVPARISGQTRLIFRLNETARVEGIPLSIDGLLNWSVLELVASPIADATDKTVPTTKSSIPNIQPPGDLETAIELPYRLIISPNHGAQWRHPIDVVMHKGRVELWHTAIVRSAGNGTLTLTDAENPEPLRAIWSPDYNPHNPPVFGEDDPALGLTAMTPYDRHQIVILTSDFHHHLRKDGQSYLPLPFLAEQLILSPLGGWLKSRGGWEPPFARPQATSVSEFPWRDILPHLPSATRSMRDTNLNGAVRDTAFFERFDGVFNPGTTARRADPRSFTQVGPITGELASVTGGIDKIWFPRLGDQLDLSEWVHVATQGRDQYVRIVYEGRLYPFGHRAALVKVTERKFRNLDLSNGATTVVAYMVQKMFIVVRERVRDYTDVAAISLSNEGRAMPLKRVRLSTTVTPTISYPYSEKTLVPGASGVFWVMVDQAGAPTDFLFHAVGTDVMGDEIDFTASLIFVPNSRCGILEDLKAVRVDYANSKQRERRACRTTGQRLTLAPRELGSAEETTTVETHALYFETERPPGDASTEKVREAFFTPRLYKAEINIPAVAAVVGARTITTIAYFNDYLDHAFSGAGSVFAKVVKEGPIDNDNMPTLVGDAISASFSAERGGGIATPNMNITCLSRRHGPLAGDVEKAAANTFDPGSFFPKGVPDAGLLFGSFSLGEVVNLPGVTQTMDKDAPKMRVKTETVVGGSRIVAELDWHPTVGNVDEGVIKFIGSDHSSSAVLDITARIETLVAGAAGNESITRIDGALKNFRIEFTKVVFLHVDQFAFSSKSGEKPDVAVQLNSSQPVTFAGDLDFVESLRRLIPPGLLGDGPSLDINEQRVHAGFSISIPPASVGVFSLSNIRLGAFVELPFIEGRPLFDFAFAQRQEPFTLAVALLGGTGFFHVQLDTDGIRLLEAAFEFGAVASIDIGVASGSVHILAGIYFKLEKKTSEGDLEAMLTGYMRLGGELSVLGIVSMSVEFVLSFTYHDKKATGRATLTVKIEIAFFSKSIELSVERSFGRDGGDPAFYQMLPTPNLWSDYAAAFA